MRWTRRLALGAGLLSLTASGAVYSWSGGGGANANWSLPDNWGFAGTPGNGDTVIFPAGQPNLINTNNFIGLTLNQIKFVGPGGGYDLRGNAFTLTNSIIATNTAGANIIENNLALATITNVLFVVSNGASLTLKGNLSGAVGVNKEGLGTLTYQCVGDNTYQGITLVSGGTLQLNVSGFNAFGGPLVIGDKTATLNPTVRDLQSQEIPDGVAVTLNLTSVLDINNWFETISTNLTLENGTIQTGTGALTLSPNTTITTKNPFYFSYFYGHLNLSGGTLAILGNAYLLDFEADVDGSAAIVQADVVNTLWNGTNTYMASYTANGSGAVELANSSALGNITNTMTINGQTAIYLYNNINLTNKSLTLNSTNPSPFYDFGPATNSWTADFILSTNVTINCFVPGTALTLNINNSISGPGGIIKSGPGVLTLSSPGNVSSYTGDTVVNQGILNLNSPNVIRFGTLRIGDGVGGSAVDIVRYLSPSCIYGGPGGSTVVITNSGWLDLNGFSDDVGPIAMDGAFITTGAGTLTLFPPLVTLNSANGASTIFGNLSINSGGTNIYTFGTTNDLYLYAAVSDSSSNSLVKTGPGDLFLLANNTYTGPTIIQQGSVWAENPLALGTTNSGTIVSNGASLILVGNIGITNETLTLNGFGNGSTALNCQYLETNTWAGPIILATDSSIGNFSANAMLRIIGPISGPGGLLEDLATGTLSLEGSTANTYGGITTVNSGTTLLLHKTIFNQTVPGNLVVNGTVRLGSAEQIAGSADMLLNPGSLFDTSVSSEILNTLHGSGTVNFGSAGWIQVGASNGTSIFNGNFTGGGFPSGYTVGKTGTGTFTINGNSTYTSGITHVLGGKLLINGSQPAIPVTVDAGTTLGGSGTVGIITANGSISPGPGILNSGNVTFSGTGNLTVELDGPNPGTGYDQLNVTGTAGIAAATTLGLNLAFTSPVAVGQQFIIVNNDGADGITGTFSGLPEGSSFQQNGYKVTISYVGGSGNDVVLTLTSIPGATVSSTVTAGDGSHGIDPNGCNNLALVFTNTTASPMTGIAATLSTTTEGVLITQPYASYPNIPAHGNGTNLAPFQISTLPSFVCGTPIVLQLIINSSVGSFIMPFVQSTGESAAPTRFDNNTTTNVPDVGGADSTNTVSLWAGGPITKVTVSLWLDAPIDSDLNLSLIAPNGTTVPLATGAGGSNPNFGTGNADASRTTFDDAAATAIASGAAPFTGTFRPQSPLSALIGTSPNGAWHLHIQDGGFFGSPDTLHAWSLNLSGTACNTGSGNCDVCMTPISNSIVTLSDPVQAGRWIGNAIVASCGVPKAWVGTVAGSLHYNAYTFTNTSPADACVTVELQSSSNLLATAYLNTFIPASVVSNYLGDAGNSTHGGQTTFSCTVPAGAAFQVVVTEVIPSTGAVIQPYTLTLSGLPCPPPTLTVQSVPAGKARLYWPTWAGGYLLEATPSLYPTNWAYITNEPIVAALQYNVTNATSSSTNRFYRLHKP